MADITAESEVVESGSGDAGLSNQENQPAAAVKKTPLRDLHNDSNIIAQKPQHNPLPLKESVISDATKVSGTKRPSPGSHTSHQHVPSSSNASGHLVYVRRKYEAEAGKGNHSEVTNSTSNSNIKPVSDEPNTKPVSNEPKSQSVHYTVTSPSQPRVNKGNWEERYVRLQMYLKVLDQSSLEDHLKMLRSLSAVELNRHAIELEMRAIQLSLEQGRELQRVKDLNVVGKQLKTSNTGPPTV